MARPDWRHRAPALRVCFNSALLRRLLFGLAGAFAGLAAEVAAALALNGLTGRALAEYIGVDLTLLSFVAAALVGALVGLRIERR